MDPKNPLKKLPLHNSGNSYVEEDEGEIDSLFEQDTLYRQSKFLAHLTIKASLHIA
jgi:hypothetical protein